MRAYCAQLCSLRRLYQDLQLVFFYTGKNYSNRGRKIKRGIFVKPNTMKKLIVFVKHYEKNHSVCKHYEKNNSVWQTL